MVDQLTILSDNLDAKISVLEEIRSYNVELQVVLSQDDIDITDFDETINEKDGLIQKLEQLDSDFESIYQGVKGQIENKQDVYAEQIKVIQEKIARINSLSSDINKLEGCNKELITGRFMKIKEVIKQGRQGSKVASSYYNNMSGGAVNTNQFMDNKF